MKYLDHNHPHFDREHEEDLVRRNLENDCSCFSCYECRTFIKILKKLRIIDNLLLTNLEWIGVVYHFLCEFAEKYWMLLVISRNISYLSRNYRFKTNNRTNNTMFKNEINRTKLKQIFYAIIVELNFVFITWNFVI